MAARNSWTSFCNPILGAIFPPKCSLCEVLSPQNPCSKCIEELGDREIQGEEFFDGLLDYCYWLYSYDGRGGQAVRHLKYRRSTALVAWMSTEIAEGFEAMPQAVDAIVPVPIHWSRRAVRGFNQSDLLVESLPVEALKLSSLLRIKATKSQAGLDQAQRLKNLHGAFRASQDLVEGKHLLLVDDVMTTGHTLRMCAQELKSQKAATVGALVFARSDYPPKRASAT